jgi:SAM-dependent methyltransferase
MSNLGKYRSSNPVKKALLNRFLNRTRSIVGSNPGRVLDVGTGEGLYWETEHDFEVVGVDVRLEALTAASQNGIRCAQASAFALPFPDRTFDLVLAVEILEHLDEPGSAVKELARVSRDRGLITVPWEPWFSLMVLAGSGSHPRRMGREPEHIQAFGPRSLEALLADHFPVVEVSTKLPWIVAEVAVAA